MLYRIRIDCRIQEDQLRSFFNSYNDIVIVHHQLPKGNPHWHLYLNTERWKSPQSIRYSLRTQFPNLRGGKNGDYAIGLCDIDRIDEYLQYLFNRKHGNIPTLVFSTIDLTNHKKRADEVASDFMEKYGDKTDITNYDISKMLAEYIRTNGLNQWSYDDKQMVVRQAINLHNQYSKSYCEYSLQKVITTAMGLTDWRSVVEANVFNKMFVPRQ